jgi:hypothetical protein
MRSKGPHDSCPKGWEKLTNPTVRTAIHALQQGDRAAWEALFESNAKLYNDCSPRSLERFNQGAIGRERFTSIDLVENNGRDITGQFHSEEWGDFRTYFRFQLSLACRIQRLDIGGAR